MIQQIEIHKYDLFGIVIGMTYNNDTKYKTRLGGICSLVLIVASLFLFINMFWKLVWNPDFPPTWYPLEVDLLYDLPHNLAENKFFIAVNSDLEIEERFGTWKAYQQIGN